jgi:phosphoadenosine phosphosulfate reductase
MRVIMVKKRLADGSPCRKCVQAEERLRRSGVWGAIDEVIWADEGDADSPGMGLAAQYGIETAPFFLVTAGDTQARVYTSTLTLLRDVLKHMVVPEKERTETDWNDPRTIEAHGERLAKKDPLEIVRWSLDTFGDGLAIAFSGAEDVALIDMMSKAATTCSIFTLDTGRLHPETYEFIDTVSKHYGVSIDVMSPDHSELEAFVAAKGLFSFYEDGHGECCAIRKVAPLGRALLGRRAWMTGQRRDQSPATRDSVPVFEQDPVFSRAQKTLLKVNPLAHWTSKEVWDYLRTHDVPTNKLHLQGYRSIGCAPCTRPTKPDEHERAGRWWWEEATKRECGLHLEKPELSES